MSLKIVLPLPLAGKDPPLREAKLAEIFDHAEKGLSTLLGKQVRFKDARAESKLVHKGIEELGKNARFALLLSDRNMAVCGCALDARLAILSAGALMMVPPAGLQERLRDGAVDGLWAETVNELLNVILGCLGQALRTVLHAPDARFPEERYNAPGDLPRTAVLVVQTTAQIGAEPAGRFQLWLEMATLNRL